MRKTGFAFNTIYLEHNTGFGHPERAERLVAINNKLNETKLIDKLIKLSGNKSQDECIKWIEKIHSSKYIKYVQEEIKSGTRYLDSYDTEVSLRSFDAAINAINDCLNAVDKIITKEIDNAFLSIRPPGHHAEYKAAMGFCIFNNIAITARYAQLNYNLSKVMIVDWDVHHGNGTQNAFWEDDGVFFISLHQYPHYPGTGSSSEIGGGKGKGFTLNIPMKAGSGDSEYLKAFEEQIIPKAEDFKPDIILISAGYDAHKRDMLGNINLSSEVYGKFTKMLLDIADKYSNGRIIAMLEGGYDLIGLSEGVYWTIKTLLDNELN